MQLEGHPPRSAAGDLRGFRIMSCRDTIHLICWYLEGKLSPAVEGEIAKHLHDCSDCRLVMDAATTTLDRYFGPTNVIEAGTVTRAA
jgi:predicted anti-sigma-YlaC factor YlaD